jgi:hypothetical protein
MHYFLGLEVWQNPGEICLSQGKYVVEILNRFEMMDCKSMPTPIKTKIQSYYVILNQRQWMPLCIGK